jgi:hypothetical protein
MENKEKNDKKELNDANNILEMKKWLFILLIVGVGIGFLFFSSELTTPLMIMMIIAVLFFGFDYFTWHIFLISMKEKKFSKWIKVADKLKNHKKNKGKIENKLVVSAILILGLSFAFKVFDPLYVQIVIGCVLFYILYLYYGYSSLELVEKIPNIIKESK